VGREVAMVGGMRARKEEEREAEKEARLLLLL